MEKISLFEIFKIGIGPSSPHAMGPWKAVCDFLKKYYNQNGSLENVIGLKVELFGSLAKTGTGHGTDKAIIMGLTGADITTFKSHQLIPSIEKINLESSIEDISEWDSFAHIQLLDAIEEEFKIEIGFNDAIIMTSIPIIKKKIMNYL